MTPQALRERLRLRTPEPLQPAPRLGGTLFLVGVTVLSFIFWDSLFLLPLRLLVVTFHELGHALVTILTGGQVLELAVGVNEGGHTLSSGGIGLLILNGGYLGSGAFGLMLLMLTQKEGRGRVLSALLGLGLLATALLWVPFFSFGFFYVTLSGFAFLWASRRLGSDVADLGVRAIGLFSVLYALFDIRVDVFGGTGISDAVKLAYLTGIPAVLWGGSWLLGSVALLWLLRRRWL